MKHINYAARRAWVTKHYVIQMLLKQCVYMASSHADQCACINVEIVSHDFDNKQRQIAQLDDLAFGSLEGLNQRFFPYATELFTINVNFAHKYRKTLSVNSQCKQTLISLSGTRGLVNRLSYACALTNLPIQCLTLETSFLLGGKRVKRHLLMKLHPPPPPPHTPHPQLTKKIECIPTRRRYTKLISWGVDDEHI